MSSFDQLQSASSSQAGNLPSGQVRTGDKGLIWGPPRSICVSVGVSEAKSLSENGGSGLSGGANEPELSANQPPSQWLAGPQWTTSVRAWAGKVAGTDRWFRKGGQMGFLRQTVHSLIPVAAEVGG